MYIKATATLNTNLKLCALYYQSSTLTTGPKVMASKDRLGLVKIGSLEVPRAYKHFVYILNYSISLIVATYKETAIGF